LALGVLKDGSDNQIWLVHGHNRACRSSAVLLDAPLNYPVNLVVERGRCLAAFLTVGF
jgi:hypothetical protein